MKKILVAHNIRPLLEKEKSILLRKKIEIMTATSGAEFLKLHSDELTDLIIMNLNMTGIDGDEVCTRLRQDVSLKKVSIILVCESDRSAISRCQACGANAFITRPFDDSVLFRNIKKFLFVAERQALRIIFQVFVKGEYRDRFFFANSLNISSSGVLLETDEVMEQGERNFCSFFVDQDLITLQGKVLRISEQGTKLFQYGIQFVNVSLGLQNRIEEFIRRSVTQ